MDFDERVAIVSMSVKLPRNITECDEMWELLLAGKDVFERGPIRNKNVSLRSHIADASWFASDQFGISPFEADLMDPQHRILLELSWECLANANSGANDRVTGAFASCSASSFFQDILLFRPDLWERECGQILSGNQPDSLATRIAYSLGLRGPAMYVGTACSSSLVAVHQAVQAINGFQCDQALVAAACIRSPRETGYEATPGGIYSPDGVCRPFSNAANGTVPGNGAAVVLLKRLEDALADGDYIYAVIEGCAVNNDGQTKVGFTAPSVEGQVDCISIALDVAQVKPSDVVYIEAHGTGTNVGDPIELRALSMAYGKPRAGADRFVGTIKANIGHTDAAAGLFGLIKTAMVLDRKVLPPQINLGTPTAKYNWEENALRVAQETVDLGVQFGPDSTLTAGVSALGVGGTNAHVVLRDSHSIINRKEKQPPRPIARVARRKEHGVTISSLDQGDRPAQPGKSPAVSVEGMLSESSLMKIFSRYTFDPITASDDNFFDLGGDSLGLIYLAGDISDATGIEIPIDSFSETPTVAFAKKVLGDKATDLEHSDSRTLSLNEDFDAVNADISARIASCPIGPIRAPLALESDMVLLTGATGFVGSFILSELLSRGVKVSCLLRDGNAGRDRLVSRLKEFNLWDEDFRQTLDVIEGDITKPRLGIVDSVYDKLSCGVARIIHSAAWVNHVYSYSQLAAANAHSAVELLRFAGTSRSKELTFVSTSAVFESSGYTHNTEISNNPLVAIPPESNGYARSKAAAELYFGHAADFNVLATIVRIPNIFGDRKSFQINRNDALWNWIRAIIVTDRYPSSFDAHGYDFCQALPADAAAQLIVDAERTERQPGCSIINAIPNLACSSRSILAGLREAGHQPQPMADLEWYSLVSRLDRRDLWVAGIAMERANQRDINAVQRLFRYCLDDTPSTARFVNVHAIWSPADIAPYIRTLQEHPLESRESSRVGPRRKM